MFASFGLKGSLLVWHMYLEAYGGALGKQASGHILSALSSSPRSSSLVYPERSLYPCLVPDFCGCHQRNLYVGGDQWGHVSHRTGANGEFLNGYHLPPSRAQ